MQGHKIEDIENNVRVWTRSNLSESFEFRPGQFESIVGIIYSIVNNGLENNILQAPTGTGKSFICIISAGVLAQYYGIKSYILASDLYLWKQYADAIDKFKLRQFGYMKGSMGNYRCNANYQDYEMGECKQKRVSLNKFRKDKDWAMNKWPCSTTCQYLKDRFRAEKTPVTLLTYQLWLYQMNLVKNTDEDNGFTPRDVIFCDECHNIPEIISRFAQPQISAKYDRSKLFDIVDYAIKHRIGMTYNPMIMVDHIAQLAASISKNEFDDKHITCDTALDSRKILEIFDYVIDSLNYLMKDIPLHTKCNVKLDVIIEYVKMLSAINDISTSALEAYEKNIKSNEKDSDLSSVNSIDNDILGNKKDKRNDNESALKCLTWIHNYFSSFAEYIKAIKQAGKDYIVIEKTEDDDMIPTFTFYCVKEDYLCKEYLLTKAKYKVMTSATVGNINAFITNIGIDMNEMSQKSNLVAFTSLPNIFDFKQSPIFYLPNYKMSFKDKSKSFPEIQNIIYKICEMYPNVHGMINTGSYANSKLIVHNAPASVKRRLCSYDSAKNKTEQIQRFMSSDNKILIGPTLVEGVDLPGDLCRFIIIAKLPYPNISSPMTKAKMNLFPLWYSSTTSNTMIQNIGRGVRFQGDWCYTFILDGCFDGLYNQTYNQYAPEIQQRFIRITPNYIDECLNQCKK